MTKLVHHVVCLGRGFVIFISRFLEITFEGFIEKLSSLGLGGILSMASICAYFVLQIMD